MEQGSEVPFTLQSDFACLEKGFTGVSSQIAAASGRFRTTGGVSDPDAIPIGQNRLAARGNEE
ncbi:hypothetical protein [Paenibacillus contaminans]|uniref:hypothetical protein n=1 Tax=Paenibacillus contaminans TaxID=450362 RepID=UPI0011BFD123|nr:hypothetical protein [Paenibacillus contaminans]